MPRSLQVLWVETLCGDGRNYARGDVDDSRARGLFAGISLAGSTVRPDNDANERIYGKPVSAREIVLKGAVRPTPDAALLLKAESPQPQEHVEVSVLASTSFPRRRPSPPALFYFRQAASPFLAITSGNPCDRCPMLTNSRTCLIVRYGVTVKIATIRCSSARPHPLARRTPRTPSHRNPRPLVSRRSLPLCRARLLGNHCGGHHRSGRCR